MSLPGEVLTLDELRAASGYRQSAAIRRWLDAEGVPYLTSRTGLPLVRRDDLRGRGVAAVRLNLGALDGTRRKTATA